MNPLYLVCCLCFFTIAFMLHTTQGIVLKTFKYSETSVIAKVYTQKLGLQSYIINGVHTPKAKYKPALLQPLSLLDMVVYAREHKEIQHVKEIAPAGMLVSIPHHVVKSAIALFIAEILYKTLKEETGNAEQFDFLQNTILFLDQCTSNQVVANLHLWFLVHFTAYLGFFPQQNFFYTDRNIFDLREGLFVHRLPTHPYSLTLPHSYTLSQLLKMPIDQIDLIKLDKKQRHELLGAMVNYYQLHVAGFSEVKSVQVLNDVFA